MPYERVQFIGYPLYTGPEERDEDGERKQRYLGLPEDGADIAARVQLLKAVLNITLHHPEVAAADRDVLKVLMIPEFFFRGRRGAYQMDDVAALVSQLQQMVQGPQWADWLFLFGTIVGYAVKDPVPASEGAPVEPREGPDEGAATAEVYNFCLVQRGGFGPVEGAGPAAARVVLKEFKSNLDFIFADAFDLARSGEGLAWEQVEHLEPLGETRNEVQLFPYDGQAVFSQDGLTFGVEICLDHDAQRLEGSRRLPPIDIQLIPSCGMTISPEAIVVGEGGFVFNCDGYGPGFVGGYDYHTELVWVGARRRTRLRPTVETLDPLLGGLAHPGIQLDEVRELFALGPGEIHIYGPLPLPSVARN